MQNEHVIESKPETDESGLRTSSSHNIDAILMNTFILILDSRMQLLILMLSTQYSLVLVLVKLEYVIMCIVVRSDVTDVAQSKKDRSQVCGLFMSSRFLCFVLNRNVIYESLLL